MKTKKNIILLLTIALVFLTFTMEGCNKRQETPEGTAGLSQDQTGAKEGTKKEDIYPHSSEFSGTGLHGVKYYQGGDECRTCHGAELLGGNSGVSCLKCHQTFPHTAAFKSSSEHGKSYQANKGSCIKCHGNDFQGGNSKVSCYTCHDFPHQVGWGQKDLHGLKFLSDTQAGASCLKCHPNSGNENDKSNSITCNSCHTLMPHNADYKSPAMHGKDFLGNKGSCFNCHTERDSKSKISSCSKCHEYPHVNGWTNSESHGKAFFTAEGNGKPNPECLKCHQKDIAPTQPNGAGTGNKAVITLCNSCHIAMPHPKSFKPGSVHGKAFLEDRTKCIVCHKPGAKNTPSQETCKKCHEYPHSNDWAAPAKHGAVYLANKATETAEENKKPVLGCTKCHPLKSAETPADASDASGPCNACHSAFPHPEDYGMNHKNDARTYAGKCTICHKDLTEHLEYKCTDCHGGDTYQLNIKWEEIPIPPGPTSMLFEDYSKAVCTNVKTKITRSFASQRKE